MKEQLADVQGLTDIRGIRIPKVGVRNVDAAFFYMSTGGAIFQDVGKYSLYASLGDKTKGVNMSRFVEALMDVLEKRSIYDSMFKFLDELSKDIASRMESEEGHAKVRFKFLFEKESPISKKKAQQAFNVEMESDSRNKEIIKRKLIVHVPYGSLCPCSKQMCERGAHNQRSVASITILCDKDMNWQTIERVIKDVEKTASSAVYPILKRDDEKEVTERAYNKPMFVEDMVRDLQHIFNGYLQDKTGLVDFCIVCNHFESIHNHDCTAIVYAGKELN